MRTLSSILVTVWLSMGLAYSQPRVERIYIDGAVIYTSNQLHDRLAMELQFPDYYGRNLDALYDILTKDIGKPTLVTIRNADELRANIGAPYMQSFIETVRDAERDGSRVVFRFRF